jgi:NTP pyrophosphatase (non-canonical NTP hydrolase)
MTLKDIGDVGHHTSLEKGFLIGAPSHILGESDARKVLSYLALIHSEVSEAVEEARRGDVMQMGHELADVILHVARLCYTMNVPLDEFVQAKLDYNKTRPYKHGDKLV